MLYKFFCIGMILIALPVDAGLYDITYNSRANCGNNESITWFRQGSRQWRTISVHQHNTKGSHVVDTGWEKTWRSAAVHWGEAVAGSGWTVCGYHHWWFNNRDNMMAITCVDDCSIYDGWWS